MPRAYNPNQICRMLSVGRDTVMRWLKDGKLRSYQIPFSNHRKVLHDDLEAFCKEHGMHFAFEPLVRLPNKREMAKSVIACGIDPSMSRQLKKLLNEEGFDLIVVEDVEQVFAMASRDKVFGVLLDMAIGRRAVMLAGKQVAGMKRRIMQVALVYADQEDESQERASDFFTVVHQPADVSRVAQLLTASRRPNQ